MILSFIDANKSFIYILFYYLFLEFLFYYLLLINYEITQRAQVSTTTFPSLLDRGWSLYGMYVVYDDVSRM